MIYHVYDKTTSWCEFLQYCELCHQLDIPNQPSITRYIRYRNYLKSVGIL